MDRTSKQEGLDMASLHRALGVCSCQLTCGSPHPIFPVALLPAVAEFCVAGWGWILWDLLKEAAGACIAKYPPPPMLRPAAHTHTFAALCGGKWALVPWQAGCFHCSTTQLQYCCCCCCCFQGHSCCEQADNGAHLAGG